ncbi:MAG: PD-(D/E)XK nuclease family transposase [Methylococcales bacterium]|jgi:predicted transposase/invertase (TIGR01784 family)
MKKVASLRYGVIFKKAFCDVTVFKGFVRDILGINLEIDKVETEKEFEHPVGRVKPEFDLFAEDKKNRVIVDIQHEKHSDHYDRFLHYHCAAILEQIPNSKDYKPPLAVYTIVVLTSGDTHKCDVSVIDFDPKKINGEPLGIIKHKVIFICPKYINDNTPELFREWLRVINESLTEQIEETAYKLPEVQKIIEHIEQEDISPQERAMMIEEYHSEEIQTNAIKKVGKAMLEKGLDISGFCEITGFSFEEIEQADSNL